MSCSTVAAAYVRAASLLFIPTYSFPEHRLSLTLQNDLVSCVPFPKVVVIPLSVSCMYKAFSVKFVVNEVKDTDVATAAGAITKYGFLHIHCQDLKD